VPKTIGPVTETRRSDNPIRIEDPIISYDGEDMIVTITTVHGQVETIRVPKGNQ
jgi:hypothetical protein